MMSLGIQTLFFCCTFGCVFCPHGYKITASLTLYQCFRQGKKKEEGERKRKTNVSLVGTVSYGHL